VAFSGVGAIATLFFKPFNQLMDGRVDATAEKAHNEDPRIRSA
jgi:hypothetical protein